MKKRFQKLSIAILAAFSLMICGCADNSVKVTSTPEYSGETPRTEDSSQSGSADKTDINEPEFSETDKILSEMSLEEKIYQMFIVTPEALVNSDGYVTAANDDTREAFKSAPVGGVILFAGNIESSRQTREMLSAYQQFAMENSGIGLFIAVDEEGGKVARIAQKLGTYSCKDMAYYGERLDFDSVYELGKTIGAALGDLGFNVDLAPVADVNISPTNELGDRIFSSDADVVSKMTASFVKGAKERNILATLKHFPGLGAGSGNTHNGSVVIERTLEELKNTEFAAFAGGIDAGVDLVMVGHQITTASGDGLPGDLSSVVVSQWLKNDLGFNGLVITDAHGMGAITDNYSSAEAAILAVKAGVDLILMPQDLKAAAEGIIASVESGAIPEERIDESVSKILQKKAKLELID